MRAGGGVQPYATSDPMVLGSGAVASTKSQSAGGEPNRPKRLTAARLDLNVTASQPPRLGAQTHCWLLVIFRPAVKGRLLVLCQA
jgi:hypothetical protein